MARESAALDEVATELETWPGVRLERHVDGTISAHYHHSHLGTLYPGLDVAELPFQGIERDALIDDGAAEPASATPESTGVSHDLRGPSDITAVLDLFDRRYHNVRGEAEPAT